MNTFLFGATGALGYEILKLLVRPNNYVKVLVRKLSNPLLDEFKSNTQVGIIQGDVFDREKLPRHFEGCDIIISALGTGKENVYTEAYSTGGRNILNAMRDNHIRKLITVTSGLTDLSDPGTDNFFLNRIIRPNLNKVYYDQTRWETILDETKDIDWICIRPANLNNKPASGKYRISINHVPKGGWKISRADIADFIVKQLTSDEYVHQKPVIAY